MATTITSTAPQLTNAQKAAAVIVSLGTDKASQLYQYMEPEDLETLLALLKNLGRGEGAL